MSAALLLGRRNRALRQPPPPTLWFKDQLRLAGTFRMPPFLSRMIITARAGWGGRVEEGERLGR